MNNQHHNTAPVEPATFLDLDEPIAEAFYMTRIACEIVQDAIRPSHGEKFGDLERYYFDREQLDTIEFAVIRASFLARMAKLQFREINDKINEARQSSDDPLLVLVKKYEAGLAAYNAAPDPMDGDAERALVAATYGPSFAALTGENAPEATTRAGVLAALRMAQAELRHSGGDGKMATAILQAVLPFLEREAA